MTHNIMNGKVTIEKKPIRNSINLISEKDANKRSSARLFEQGDRGAQAGIMDNEIKSDTNGASSTPPQESKQIYSESDIKHAPLKISDRFKGVQTSQKSRNVKEKLRKRPSFVEDTVNHVVIQPLTFVFKPIANIAKCGVRHEEDFWMTKYFWKMTTGMKEQCIAPLQTDEV